MNPDNLSDYLYSIINVSFLSTLGLGLGLIFYGVINDYLLYPLFTSVQDIVSSLGLDSWVNSLADTTLSSFSLVPAFLDVLWLIAFISYISILFVSSYETKRLNYYTTLSYLVFGSMIFMFLSSLFLILSDWFLDDIVFKFLPNLSVSTPLFTFYITNAGFINLFIFGALLFVNMVDFDFSSYFMRKDKEIIKNDEVL